MNELKEMIRSDNFETRLTGGMIKPRVMKVAKKKRLVQTPLVLNGRRIYELIEDE